MEITRASQDSKSPNAEQAESIALGLMGAKKLNLEHMSDSVTWQKGSDGALMGRDSISAAISHRELKAVIIDEIVTHGKAAAVSGRIRSNMETRLFCHMIKFTSSSAKQVASIVSFDHPLKDPSR